MNVRVLRESERDWAASLVAQYFGTPEIISRGVRHDTRELPGLVCQARGQRLGLLQYHIVGERCEVVTLVALRPRQGVGRRMLKELASVARVHGCRCLWLVTTNDNRVAQQFYEALGWRLMAVHPGAVAAARRLKPQIPKRSADGTAIEDELEYELGLGTKSDGLEPVARVPVRGGARGAGEGA